MEKTLKEQLAEFGKDLKEFFNTTSKFKDFKLQDGTIVRCDTEQFGKGSKLDVIDEKGNVLPLPDGEYSLEGQSFTVESGYIKEIKAAEMPPAVGGEMPAEGGDMAQMMDMLKSLEARIAALEGGGKPAEEMQADITKANENVAGVITKMESVEKENTTLKTKMGEMFELVEKIANSTEDPSTKVKNSFFKEDKDGVKTDVDEFRKKYLTK